MHPARHSLTVHTLLDESGPRSLVICCFATRGGLHIQFSKSVLYDHGSIRCSRRDYKVSLAENPRPALLTFNPIADLYTALIGKAFAVNNKVPGLPIFQKQRNDRFVSYTV